MKKIFIILFLFSITSIKETSAQAPNWLWAKGSTGGSCGGMAGGISTSPSGNIYFSGRSTDTFSIGGKTIITKYFKTFSGKMNSSGNTSRLTAHSTYGTSDWTYGLAVDKEENTYTSGILNSGYTMYLDKYDSAGTLQWIDTFRNGAGGYGITTDNAGNIFLTGDYRDSINFGVVTLRAEGKSIDIFLAKFNKAGICQWATSAGGTDYDGGRGIVRDKSGFIYICGSYNGKATFGTINPPEAEWNHASFFIAKYDSLGNALWLNTATNAGFGHSFQSLQFNGIAIDSFGNLLVTGSFEETARFGKLSLTSTGDDDIFVAKCLNAGKWDWVKRAGGKGNDIGSQIALDKNNDAYITGYFSGTAKFEDQIVNDTTSLDSYIAKYVNSTGDLQWVQTGSHGASGGSSITIDKNGYPYIIGYFRDSASFDTTILKNENSCQNGLFIAKLDTSPYHQILAYPDSFYCLGSVQHFPYTVSGLFDSSNVFSTQLSDSTGSFINPINIGSVKSTVSGIISASIPINIPAEKGYAIRIVSSKPVYGSTFNYNRVRIGTTIDASVSSDTSICLNSEAHLRVKGASSYLWSPSSTLNCDTCQNPTASPVKNTTYHVTLFGNNCVALDSIIVSTKDTPTVYFTRTDSSLKVFFNSYASLGTKFYHWNFGDGGTSEEPNPAHIYSAEDSFNVCLTVTNDSGCAASFCQKVAPLISSGTKLVAFKINNLTIHPNPCNTCLLKGDAEPSQLFVTDIMGKNIQASFIKTGEGYTIYFPGNNKGMFLVRNNKTGEVVKLVRE